jgi:hypothetical protein
MPEEGFRLPGSSYAELTKIIQGYAKQKGKVPLDEVSKVVKMQPSQISRNNGFLVAIGVLEGGKNKEITDSGRALALALQHDMTEDIRGNWRAISLRSDFLDKLLTAVRIRRGMDEATLKAHVAYSAGQPKTPMVLTGAGAVIDLLKTAGLLVEQEGKLVATDWEDRRDVGSTTADSTSAAAHPPEQTVIPADVATTVGPAGVSIQVQLQIQVDQADLEALAPRLRRLIASLSSAEDPDPAA